MWVKICGIRDVETARRVCELGATAIGLNFFASSPRCVDVPTAARIVQAVTGTTEPVGLFVNHSLQQVVDIVSMCALRTLQFHGDETPEFLAEVSGRLPELRLLRAFRIGESGCAPLADYLAECRRLDVEPAGCLVDSHVPGKYGGTGQAAPWDLLAEQYDSAHWPPLIVAGGLNPANVVEAIQRTRPYGVDVASGVESSRGGKDLELVRRFIQAASAVSVTE